MRAVHAIWSLDGGSFYLLNQAYMILLRKKHGACFRHWRLQAHKPDTQLCQVARQGACVQARTSNENSRQIHPKRCSFRPNFYIGA